MHHAKAVSHWEVYSWSDHVTDIPMSVRVFCAIASLLILIFGNGLLASIYLFERGLCGSTHDPKKRTAINSLQSSAALAFMASITLGHLVLLWRILIGPVNVSVSSIVRTILCHHIFGSMALEYLVEVMVLRYLFINVWKSLPPFNEDFFVSFITAVNVIIPVMMSILTMTTGQLENEDTLILGGLHPVLAKRPVVSIK